MRCLNQCHACTEDNYKSYRRYFQIARITVCVESELDLTNIKFKDELMAFAVDVPGDDNIALSHHFGLPDLSGKVYCTPLSRQKFMRFKLCSPFDL